MDDDVLPEEDCLSNLLQCLNDGVRMCVPSRSDDNFEDFAIQKFDLDNPFCYKVNACKKDMINGKDIKEPYVYVEDIAFEGPIFETSLAQEIGNPDKNYFILFDDTDYAQRALIKTKIRYVTNAKMHKQITLVKGKNIWSWKTFYSIRNSMFFDKKYGHNWAVRNLRPWLRKNDLCLRAILKGNFYRLKWIYKAYQDGRKGIMGKTVEPQDIVTHS